MWLVTLLNKFDQESTKGYLFEVYYLLILSKSWLFPFFVFWTYLREYARLFTNQNHTWLASSRAKPRITEIGACSIVIEPCSLKLICPKTRFVITAGDLLISSVILIMFTKLFTNLSIPVIILYLTCHPIRPFYESFIRSSWRHYRFTVSEFTPNNSIRIRNKEW